ncbi:MAG: hypothetical protein AAF404_15930 [Pseudomonadota bacterium]
MKNQSLDADDFTARPRSRVIKASTARSGNEYAAQPRPASHRSTTRTALDRASHAYGESHLTERESAVAEAPVRARSAQRDHLPEGSTPAQRSATRQTHREQAHRTRADANSGGNLPPATPWYLQRWVKFTGMGLLLALMIAAAFLKPIDNSSESQIDSALTRALIGFGIARTLNGVISVAQGTEFAVQPAGVGVNFSPGEILDPINDLVERFSWVMLVATSSLGVQKILLDVSSWIGVSFMLAGAAVFFLLTRMQNGRASSLAKFASRLLLVMLLVRFLVPLGAIANDWVYRQFLQPQFETSSQQLEAASERIREISTRQSEAPDQAQSLRQKARNIYQSMTSKFDFDGMLNDYRQSAENVSEHAVNLIVVFLLQTIIFPLVFLYVVYRAFRYLLLPPTT